MAELNLEALEIEVSTIYRQKTRMDLPKPENVLEKGDVVVLLGRPDSLGLAEDRLIRKAD